MKILLFGASGQVGWQLQRSLATLGEVVALTSRSTGHCGDLTRPEEIVKTVRAVEASVVVNAAAYTAVDKAESEVGQAMAVNATACEALAQATRQLGAWLVHYSTDYVYNGRGEAPWRETDACEPLGVYGKSKLAGDLAVGAANHRHLILRTSWVFDSWGQNFLKSILKAAMNRDELTIVADQWGAPTRAASIADVTAIALRQIVGSDTERLAGVYHVAASGTTNWHEYACVAIEEARRLGLPVRVRPDRILRTTAAQYQAVAPRPTNSRLDTSKLRGTFGVRLPHWRDGVRAVVAELAHQSKFPGG